MRAPGPFHSFAFALAFFALAESELRWIGFDSAADARDVLFDPDDPLAGFVDPDPDLLFRSRPEAEIDLLATAIRTDSRGWRTTAAGSDSAATRLRVLCLGGGDVFGRYASYPSQLARILGKDAVVLNAGQPGFSSLQMLALLRRDGLAAEPDVVIWSLGDARGQDTRISADGLSDARRLRGGFLANLARVSRVVQFCSWLSVRIDHGASPVPRVDAGNAASALVAAGELCAAAGAKLLVVGTPPPDVAGQQVLEAAGRSRPLEGLDLAAALRDHTGADLWIRSSAGGDATQSTLGHRFAAEVIAARLRELGWASPAPGSPSPAARSSPPAAAAIDLDRDGRDEIVVVANVAGSVEAAVVDPADGTTRRLDLPEREAADDSPGASLCLTRLPALAGAAGDGEGAGGILVAWPTTGGSIETRCLDSRGAVRNAGISKFPAFAAPAGCRSISIVGLDRMNDGATAHLVCFGTDATGGPPVVRVLSETFAPLAVLEIPGAVPGCDVSIAKGSVLTPRSANLEQALVAFVTAGGPRVACLDGSRRFTELLAPLLDDPTAVISVVTGRFHRDSDADGVAVLRASFLAICTEGAGYSEPVFPFGAVHCDPSLPPPVVIRTGEADSASLVIGWRTRAEIVLLRVTPEGVGKPVAIPIQG